MVGEDNISVRNRRSAYGTAEGKDNVSRRLEGDWSFSKSSNGWVDVDHVITRKMQLLAEAEHLKPAFMKGIDSHFTEFVDGLVSKSVLLESSPSAFPTVRSEKDSSKTKGLRAPPEHGKVFVPRKSLLDELFEVDHIRTIYHMFIAILILFILSTLVVDFIDEGRLVLDFDLLVYSFGKFSVVAPTWLCMFLSSLAVPYGLFCQWAQGYHNSSHKTVRSFFFGTLHMLFQMLGLGLGPTWVAMAYDLPPASGFIVILEQVRLMMKAHSFIRENVPRILSASPQKTNVVQLPRFSQYLYFLFAPTLIYRDEYPRNPTRRWSYVATKFAQVLGSLFYVYYIFVRLCIPTYRNYIREPFNSRGLVLCIFNSILPGVLMLFLTFFSFLHCWLNAFAEMLRFGDRMFYKLQLATIAEKMELRAFKVKEMDTKLNSDLNEKKRKSTRETGKIYKDLILSLRVFSESVILNPAERKELEFAFTIKKLLRCHWAPRARPERKRLKIGGFIPLKMEEDWVAEFGVNV